LVSTLQGISQAASNYYSKECFGATDALVDIGANIVGGVAGRNLGLVNALGLARAGSSGAAAVARGTNLAAAASAVVTSGYTSLARPN